MHRPIPADIVQPTAKESWQCLCGNLFGAPVSAGPHHMQHSSALSDSGKQLGKMQGNPGDVPEIVCAKPSSIPYHTACITPMQSLMNQDPPEEQSEKYWENHGVPKKKN